MDGIVIFIASVVTIVATSAIKTVRMSAKQKSTVAIATSAVTGFATALIQSGGDLTAGDFTQTLFLVFGASQAIYTFVMKGTSADKILEHAFGGGNKTVASATKLIAALEEAAKEAKPAKKATVKKKAAAPKKAAE